MAKVTVGDIATYINGYSFKPDQWGTEGYPIVRIQNLTNPKTLMNHYKGDIPEKFRIRNGDLLISWSASLGVFKWDRGDAVLNQHIFKVVFDKPIQVNQEYYRYQMEYLMEIMERDVHGATMKHLTRKTFENQPFYLPDTSIQDHIANLLSVIDKSIKKCNIQLLLLNNLMKSRFIEMFGDPVLNPKAWKICTLKELGKCKNGMNFHSSDSGFEINCLGVGDFQNRDSIVETNLLPVISINEFPSADYLLNDGDIVFVRSNGNKNLVGRSVCVYPGKKYLTFSGFCIRFRVEDERLLKPNYLLRVLKTKSIREKMSGRGANIQNLNQKILGDLEIPIPPISLQEEYVSFQKSIDKSKLAIQKSIGELETLKKKLMQEYFG